MLPPALLPFDVFACCGAQNPVLFVWLFCLAAHCAAVPSSMLQMVPLSGAVPTAGCSPRDGKWPEGPPTKRQQLGSTLTSPGAASHNQTPPLNATQVDTGAAGLPAPACPSPSVAAADL